MSKEDEIKKMEDEVFHLARVALAGRPQDVAMLVRKYARRYRSTAPELAEQLTALLRKTPTRGNPARRIEPEGLPLDVDSRLPLIRVLQTPMLEAEPVYDEYTWDRLRQVVRERQHGERLAEAGVDPTRSVLFTGPPGVGKTLAAKWIARELGRPLAILDLSAVMSSFLGRTGSNLRAVLDFAREHDCILLLDELDAVAKRRDDTSEIGELKRLVTVLLQEIDEWPPSGLLLAATNHAELLDPAVWRRFEVLVEFPLPEPQGLEALLRDHLELSAGSPWPAVLGRALEGSSFSDAFQVASHARRFAALEGTNLDLGLEHVLQGLVKSLPRPRRQELAISLTEGGLLSQRQASEVTGVSRDTIRKYAQPVGGGED
jgi:SpoVK/Ycf46/Vps4 family AAA+-type ATPase